MSYTSLKEEVFEANIRLVKSGLVILTFGNASGADRSAGVLAIKPSGVKYEEMTPNDMVIVAIEDGKVVEGKLRPSSDTPTHCVLYRSFAGVGGIVHTHSTHATAWAQACEEIPAFGTTHADHFFGPVPVTRQLTADEIEEDYEGHTGRVIADRFIRFGLNPAETPGVLVAHHGPFTWGKNAEYACVNAIALEAVACSAILTLGINPLARETSPAQLAKHYLRKHGPGAYYGQK
ncbi:MAG: L-ribulose-5-phosphate 4-epimerase AraD [Spirochaetales bacterium]|nr:MAG: L-ribulose-5-phosphate 4-epimerase AraD [Spirochaetales bacterium]